jgi:hypothetical protein
LQNSTKYYKKLIIITKNKTHTNFIASRQSTKRASSTFWKNINKKEKKKDTSRESDRTLIEISAWNSFANFFE